MKNHAIAGGVTALVVTAIAIAAELYALSPRGSALEMHPPLALIFPIMLCAFLFGIACILLAPQSTRRFADAAATFCFVYLIIGIIGAFAAQRARMCAFSRFADRSEPLVAAIHAFEDGHGRPPSSLNELVPGYLAAVPGTGMGAYPHYEYDAGRIAAQSGSEWVVIVPTPTGPMSWDTFVYYPNQGYGRAGVRVGKWAYMVD